MVAVASDREKVNMLFTDTLKTWSFIIMLLVLPLENVRICKITTTYIIQLKAYYR
jgi:hypothetical protein